MHDPEVLRAAAEKHLLDAFRALNEHPHGSDEQGSKLAEAQSHIARAVERIREIA